MASSPGVPLFSSPPTHVPTSEIDLSSPLNFGTPSSRIMGTPGGSRGTPIRPRGDIGHSRRVREVNLNPTDPPVRPDTCDAIFRKYCVIMLLILVLGW